MLISFLSPKDFAVFSTVFVPPLPYSSTFVLISVMFLFFLYLFSEFCKCVRSSFLLSSHHFFSGTTYFFKFILPYRGYFFIKSLKVMAKCLVKIFTYFMAT